jgi:NAD(P)-dependent dehydrogenase (short-subunit alcohol dehydrogenase family)
MAAAPPPIRLSGWALVLGASSGFGAATARALAAAGLDVFGVHLDRRTTLAGAERVAADIEALGRRAHFFNVNAADAEKRAEVVAAMERVLTETGQRGELRVLLHSLAFGTLKVYVADDSKDVVTPAQMSMTLDVMAHSLVYWAQDVVGRGLMGPGGRIFAMTSSGGTRALPYYGPVSAAKAALESHIRQLAVELAPRRITANVIAPAATDTPFLRDPNRAGTAPVLPPMGRYVDPAEVAALAAFLLSPEAGAITGQTITICAGASL